MDRRRFLTLLAAVPAVQTVARGAAAGADAIRLIVRADDIGSSHAANLACIQCFREGIARSVEVMVPCPWFKEAARMLRETPGYDVGVHLTLTSEWEFYKWGPITRAPSLVDGRGHFHPTTWKEKGPDGEIGFLQGEPRVEEVERELRAQIELAVKEIPQVSHLSNHMGTATSRPDLRELVDRLAAEYKLPINVPGLKRTPAWGPNEMSASQREQALVGLLEKLDGGLYMLVEHPGLDTEEMRAIGHEGYRNVASHRDAVTKAFCSAKVKQAIEKRNIRLVSYRDVLSG
ncbi:MAG TPA: ChbG/HpnK family deacetylase [Phycisphaerales bacterium]|nr:ChbG/HpnK family deacetylase [Phycisphaerales bacterium]